MSDLIGQRFNNLVVLEKNNKKYQHYVCLCDCGIKKSVIKYSLIHNKTKSCGCTKSSNISNAHKKDLVGKVFNRWTVLSEVSERRNGKIFWDCRCECGVEKAVSGADLKRNKNKSCGCLNTEKMKARWSKSKNPSWNPNLTDEDRLDRRNLQEFRAWRDLVYTRDNYTCKICGAYGGVNAHHLDGWHWCKERRFDIENGITLCKRCHDEFHKIYGRKSNTAEEFFEYYLVKT